MKSSYRINVGFGEFILRKRIRPIKELRELGRAIENLKDAIFVQLKPILDWLNKIIGYFARTHPRTP